MLTTRDPLQTLMIAKETIKPSSPTPPHLKTYNLSLLDQLAPSVHMPFVFFYPNHGSSSHRDKAAQLKKSLSQTLAQYYPFSGRLVDGTRVSCNDEGVEFVEARINARLSEVVHLTDLECRKVDQLFPTGRVWGNGYEASSSLVVVQLTYFSCGGSALAVSMSHKIGDGCTLASFLLHWAAVTRRNSGEQQAVVLPPNFISSPDVNDALVPDNIGISFFFGTGKNNYVTKKFVFPNSKIAQLKAKVIVTDRILREDKMAITTTATRIELLMALLYRCATRAKMANSSNSFKAFVLKYVVNFRHRMVHPLPETTVGNFYCGTTLQSMNESELDLNFLTAQIKKANMQINGVTNSEARQWVTQAVEASMNSTRNKDVEAYFFSSLSGFPFYEIDFGWGKPTRYTIAGYPGKNVIYLMDTSSGDGIEALVSLEEEDMVTFENDEQILKFATTIKPKL